MPIGGTANNAGTGALYPGGAGPIRVGTGQLAGLGLCDDGDRACTGADILFRGLAGYPDVRFISVQQHGRATRKISLCDSR